MQGRCSVGVWSVFSGLASNPLPSNCYLCDLGQMLHLPVGAVIKMKLIDMCTTLVMQQVHCIGLLCCLLLLFEAVTNHRHCKHGAWCS